MLVVSINHYSLLIHLETFAGHQKSRRVVLRELSYSHLDNVSSETAAGESGDYSREGTQLAGDSGDSETFALWSP